VSARREPSRRKVVGVASLDRDGIVISADARLIHLVGLDAVGLPLHDLMEPNQRDLAHLIVETASDEWATAFVGLRPDARGVPVDHLVGYRRAEDRIVIAIEPADDSVREVNESLLVLVDDLVDAQRRLAERTRAPEDALEEVRSARLVLRKIQGILPICMGCHRVRGDDDLEWLDLAEYVQRAGTIALSHGYCPECAAVALADADADAG
jgi:hypothetical protein